MGARLREKPHFVEGELRLAPQDAAARDYVMSYGRITGFEIAVIYDAETGVEIERVTTGRTDRVRMGPRSLEAARLKRQLVLHHNHPSGGSLSALDVQCLGLIRSVFAHGHDGSCYFASRAGGTGDLWLRIGTSLAGRLGDAIADGIILRHEASILYAHLVNCTLARIGAIRYVATLGPGAELAFSDNRKFLLALIQEAAKFYGPWHTRQSS
jgi:hypothetical protein